MEKRKGNLKTNFSEIARELQVSRGTIYRVVNQSPLVAPATRTKVIEALNKNGYFTHHRFRKSRILFDFCDNGYLRTIGEKLLKRLPENEYSSFLTDHRKDEEGFLNTAASCDAAVFCSNPSPGLIEKVRQLNPDLFTINLNTESTADVTITPNNKLGGELAAQHLFSLGQKRIAVFLPQTHLTRMERYKGFIGEMKILDPEAVILPIDAHEKEPFCRTFERFFEKNKILPDTIFFLSGSSAQQFWESFSAKGAPYDKIGIMSYDRPEDIFETKKDYRLFDRIEFEIRHLLDWAEYYITNRPMMKKRSPIQTSTGVVLVREGSIHPKKHPVR